MMINEFSHHSLYEKINDYIFHLSWMLHFLASFTISKRSNHYIFIYFTVPALWLCSDDQNPIHFWIRRTLRYKSNSLLILLPKYDDYTFRHASDCYMSLHIRVWPRHYFFTSYFNILKYLSFFSHVFQVSLAICWTSWIDHWELLSYLQVSGVH